jgi:hypothetical protein
MDHLDYVGIFGPAKDPPQLPEPKPVPPPPMKPKKKRPKDDVRLIGRWH